MKSIGLFLLWHLICVESLLENGDDCILQNGQKGKCTFIYECPHAEIMLMNKQNPGFCGFFGLIPLTCCPERQYYPGVTSEIECRKYYPMRVCMYGAVPSLPQEFTHMALIGFGDKNDTHWLCGGSLISDKFILTAAHCLKSIEFGDAKFVRLGDLDIATNTDLADPQDFTVKRTIPHPEYKSPIRYHDIGLIELDRNIIQTKFVSMACLSVNRNNFGTQMTATGWGKTEFLGNPSTYLLKADFTVASHNVCNATYGGINPKLLPFGIIDDSQICAIGTKDQDTCSGDSGGPLQTRDSERSACDVEVSRIVGITSFGKACGISTAPGVYTRVYNYLSWIESIVWSM